MAEQEANKTEFLRAFGQRVEALIYTKFKSKEQFLRETGFYAKNLHDILTGRSDPQISTVERLAEALRVDIRDLFPPPQTP